MQRVHWSSKCCCLCSNDEHFLGSFHKIPLNNKELNLDWVKVLKRCNVQTISKNTTICSNHFRPEDVQHKVVGTKVLAFLKNKDPPTLNLNIRDKSNNDLNQNDESDEEISDDQSSELINYNIFNTSDMDCQEYSQVTNHENFEHRKSARMTFKKSSLVLYQNMLIEKLFKTFSSDAIHSDNLSYSHDHGFYCRHKSPSNSPLLAKKADQNHLIVDLEAEENEDPIEVQIININKRN